MNYQDSDSISKERTDEQVSSEHGPNFALDKYAIPWGKIAAIIAVVSVPIVIQGYFHRVELDRVDDEKARLASEVNDALEKQAEMSAGWTEISREITALRGNIASRVLDRLRYNREFREANHQAQADLLSILSNQLLTSKSVDRRSAVRTSFEYYQDALVETLDLYSNWHEDYSAALDDVRIWMTAETEAVTRELADIAKRLNPPKPKSGGMIIGGIIDIDAARSEKQRLQKQQQTLKLMKSELNEITKEIEALSIYIDSVKQEDESEST